MSFTLVLPLGACRREDYRRHADAEVYATIANSTIETPWSVPNDFSIDPAPSSRLHDPSDPDYPVLPDAGPALYSYDLPPLVDTRGERTAPRDGAPTDSPEDQSDDDGRDPETGLLPIQPIPESYWDAVPRPCLARMLEFEGVRNEFVREYGEPPAADLLDDAPRLSLRSLFELALLNSREYQSRKEALYLSALALTLERFQYFPKFSTNPGSDVTWSESRTDGVRSESMSISSDAAIGAVMSTGGEALARIANDVVLTFDGPNGFSKDVSSELLFSFSQSILQRDIRLNPLVQSERNLVYAAREFSRFQRAFFIDLAARYYAILQTYRSVEIESQNYFSFVRTFEQARAELRAGVRNAPNPVAVDQFEQGMLSARSGLIATCNNLEASLDSFKLFLGIPVETPLNLDLAELDTLSLRDEIEVAAERVRRWLNRVRDQRGLTNPDRAEILNADIFLIERLLDWLRLRRELEGEDGETESAASSREFRELLGGFRLARARIEVEAAVAELESGRVPEAPSPPTLVYERLEDVVDVLLALARHQLDHAALLDRDTASLTEARERLAALRARLAALRERLAEFLQDTQGERMQALIDDAGALRTELEALTASLEQLLALDNGGATEAERLARTLELTDDLIADVERLLESSELGLPPIEMDVDSAMETALVQRFDLMNARGRLADDRRNVKLAADELRSVLNFNASHSIRTRDNKPFKFTSDSNRTQLSLSVDLPFNRRSQRNDYRGALINYHAARRGLMAQEDEIKLDVRRRLRDLEQARIQYPISVTQAALAAEQVISVRLQLALGVEGVRGTDLLDALQSSREALIAVANSRIDSIVDRAEFVLDLEIMTLDTDGFWPPIADPAYQPEPNREYPESAGPTFGEIPRYLWVSKEMREATGAARPGEG